MGKVSIDIKGIQPLKRDLRGRFANVTTGTLAAVEKPVRAVMQDSSHEVPRDTDALADSGYYTTPELIGDEVVIEFGYGGPNIQVNPRTGQTTDEYALIVHEDLTAYHPVGKSKFFEDPLNRHLPEILPSIGNDLRRFFK